MRGEQELPELVVKGQCLQWEGLWGEQQPHVFASPENNNNIIVLVDHTQPLSMAILDVIVALYRGPGHRVLVHNSHWVRYRYQHLPAAVSHPQSLSAVSSVSCLYTEGGEGRGRERGEGRKREGRRERGFKCLFFLAT